MSTQQKIVRQLFELQPTQRLEFFEIYASPDDPNPIRLHNGQVQTFEDESVVDKPIVFRGKVYAAYPFETSEFELNGENRLPRPKIRFFNHNYYFSALAQQYDLINRKIIRKTTLLQFLDDENFEGGVNPYKDSSPQRSFPDDIFFIYRKVAENKLVMEFELATSLELENVKLPKRQILARYCPFAYRGSGCLFQVGSQGKPIANDKDKPFTTPEGDVITVGADAGLWKSGAAYTVGQYVSIYSTFKIPKEDINSSPAYDFVKDYYVCRVAHTSNTQNSPKKNGNLWERDACSKNLTGCKLRFTNPLPFGGFPGTFKHGY